MNKLLNTLKSLSDETRLRLINLLYEKELCVCDLVEALQVSQPKVSRHLSTLKNAGLVSDRKQAQWVYYSIIHHTENKFLDNLVFLNLRNKDVFKKDLKNLKEWLQRKNINCD